MAQQRITGQVKWVNLATGFWGITDKNQQDWRPLNLPEHLQQDGLTVDLTVELVEEEVSIFMWGQPVLIVNP